MGKGPLNYSTIIPAARTAQECVGMLMDHGAKRAGLVMEARKPAGVEFQIETRWGLRHYAVPVTVDATQAALVKAVKEGRVTNRVNLTSREHALDVAWRVLRDWLEVQIAMIEAGLADLERVMLSWQLVAPGKDLFEALDEQQGLMLPAAAES